METIKSIRTAPHRRINDGLHNLNDASLDADTRYHQVISGLSDYGTQDPEGGITVYFRHLDRHLCASIAQAEVIVGCIAWLTHSAILEALAAVPHGVALVVQKEDFLRPDQGQQLEERSSTTGWRDQLRRQDDCLGIGPSRAAYPMPLGSLSYCSDMTLAPVRCMGNHNDEHLPAFPRMHHKFLVFCRVAKVLAPATLSLFDEWMEGESYDEVVPYAVWSGSFNLTKNATFSLENALYITNPSIVQAYFLEWAQIEARSEPLDWEHKWCTPEWRIGT